MCVCVSHMLFGKQCSGRLQTYRRHSFSSSVLWDALWHPEVRARRSLGNENPTTSFMNDWSEDGDGHCFTLDHARSSIRIWFTQGQHFQLHRLCNVQASLRITEPCTRIQGRSFWRKGQKDRTHSRWACRVLKPWAAGGGKEPGNRRVSKCGDKQWEAWTRAYLPSGCSVQDLGFPLHLSS